MAEQGLPEQVKEPAAAHVPGGQIVQPAASPAPGAAPDVPEKPAAHLLHALTDVPPVDEVVKPVGQPTQVTPAPAPPVE